MQRRTFIAGAGAAAGLLASIPVAGRATGSPARETITSYVTNLGDLLGGEDVPVRSGDRVLLTRDRARAYDPGSIAVETLDLQRLGFLPSAQSRILAPVMDVGVEVSAHVTRVQSSPRPSIDIGIFIKGPPATRERYT